MDKTVPKKDASQDQGSKKGAENNPHPPTEKPYTGGVVKNPAQPIPKEKGN